MTRAAFVVFSVLPLVGIALGDETPAKAPDVTDFDRVIQERFGKVTEEDIHMGRLGTSRIARPAKRRIFVPATPEERVPLTKLQEEGWTASLYVLGLEGQLTGPIRTDAKAPAAALDAKEVSKLGRKAIDAKAALRDAQGEIRLEARPIPVSGPSCAGCHNPALEKGDPLGAVVYVLKRSEATAKK